MAEREKARVVAALDIGGTKIAAGLVDERGQVHARARVETPAAAGADGILEAASSVVRALIGDQSVCALGVGAAGVIDPRTGVVLSATDVLPGWAGTAIGEALGAQVAVPVAVNNDVHAHGLGEAFFGAGRDQTSMLYLAVGTGIGASFLHRNLAGGQLVGAHNIAGHAGHIPCPEAGSLPCTCGARGHLEAIAAGPALVREYNRRSGDAVASLPEVAARAGQGEARALAVVELGGRAVGAALGGLINLFDPDVVAVGGGVCGLGEPWWQAVTSAAAVHVLPGARDTTIVRSELGDDAALVGAGAMAWNLVEKTW